MFEGEGLINKLIGKQEKSENLTEISHISEIFFLWTNK